MRADIGCEGTLNARRDVVHEPLHRHVLKELDRAFNQGTIAGPSEGKLLERFVSGRDEAAFSALIARHGARGKRVAMFNRTSGANNCLLFAVPGGAAIKLSPRPLTTPRLPST